MATNTKAGSAAATAGLAGDSQSNTQSNPTNTGSSSGSGGVVDSAKQAASQAKETASHLIDQAKDQASSHVDQQRQTVASGLQAVAHAFQSMGERLRHQEQGPVAQYAAEMGHAIGGQVERLASYLQGRDMSQLVSDVEGFARRSPAVFLGSAFVLGLAASRFLKSSRPAPDSSAPISDPNHLLPPASTQTASTGTSQPYDYPGSTLASPAVEQTATTGGTEDSLMPGGPGNPVGGL